MNINQIVNMVIRMVMRRVMSRGINAGMDVVGRKMSRGQPEGTTDVPGARDSAKQAKQMIRMTGRTGRM